MDSKVLLVCMSVLLLSCVCLAAAEEMANEQGGDGVMEQMAEKTRAAEEMEEMREAAEREKREAAAREKAKQRLEQELSSGQMDMIDLPADTTPTFTAKALHIRGNTLISTAEIIEDIPLIFNASQEPITDAPSEDLYDFGALHDILFNPGAERQVSARTIQGFTRYVLHVYQEKNYAGIYVYVPRNAIANGELRNHVLHINVLEATVDDVRVDYYDFEANPKTETYLREDLVYEWSPVDVGLVTNQKALDDYVNLLNLNPDRYVVAEVSRGADPNAITVGYNIYEVNPWHVYVQLDNSGRPQRQWNPRVGVINTNLTGRDDIFNAQWQGAVDLEPFDDNYSIVTSYEVPLWSPRLRLNMYYGRSTYDVSPEGFAGFHFRGEGQVFGGILSYNLCQWDSWFLDLTGSLSHETSKSTPDLGLEYNLEMILAGMGVELYRSDDMTDTVFSWNFYRNIAGSSDREFRIARTDGDSDFTFHTLNLSHSRYLDEDQVHRLFGSFTGIMTDHRLPPAKQTTFGGLYTVRGYKEDSVVADGGLLMRMQYEFDVVPYLNPPSEEEETVDGVPEEEPLIRKFAFAGFFDYGRAMNESSVVGEIGNQDLASWGPGMVFQVTDNFNGEIYYGFPLNETPTQGKNEGRWSFNFIYRW